MCCSLESSTLNLTSIKLCFLRVEFNGIHESVNKFYLNRIARMVQKRGQKVQLLRAGSKAISAKLSLCKLFKGPRTTIHFEQNSGNNYQAKTS